MLEANFMKFISTVVKGLRKGFVMPLTLVICVIILTISSGITLILTKELYFSRLSRLSQVAYYAADDGMMCAVMIDDGYLDPDTGLGIFEYTAGLTAQNVLTKINNNRTANGLPSISLNSIKCATSDIFNTAVSGYATSPYSRTNSQGAIENGRTSTYSMTMDLGGGTTRCAQVTINKTSKYRQIISQGYANCTTTSLYRIERAIVSTTEVQ
jgi:hypothetical protein